MLRFAPSPTGDMHIGNLRVALFNHIIAKQTNDTLSIRIEDTDVDRNIDGKDKEILDILDLFKIEYEPEVILQSNNLKYHRQIALQLLYDKKAFNCFCTSDILDQKREKAKRNKIAYRYDGTCLNMSPDEAIDNMRPFTIRIKKPFKNILFNDEIKGDFDFDPNDVDSFIIMRQDKMPTYNFACAVDDMIMDIGFIIRGEDHMSNTPKQIAIRKALDYDKKIKYAHLPIILNIDGKKMSKRDDASSVKWLLSEGFIPEAIANYLILVGNKTPKEIFTLKEALEWFDIAHISKSPAKFDIKKLRFINHEHLKMMDSTELSTYLRFADSTIGDLAKVYLEEASTLNELRTKINNIFEVKTFSKDLTENAIILQNIIKEAPFFDSFSDFKKYIGEKSNLKGKYLFKPLRVVLTGSEHGPNLSDIYPHIKNFLGEIVQ
jgi:glutamyl-tRNA synthetase